MPRIDRVTLAGHHVRLVPLLMEHAGAAILRLGARFDGVLRAHKVAADGGVRDSAFYSMLRVEWPAAKARLEERLRR